jgi:protein SCO1
MTKLWKIGMLLLLLAIPAMAYIFLQLLGDNRYDVPIYYAYGVKNGSSDADCNFTQSQHHVSLQKFQSISSTDLFTHYGSGQVTVFSFLSSICDHPCQLKFNQLSRLVSFFSENPEMKILSIIYPTDTADVPDSKMFNGRFANWVFIKSEPGTLENFITCGLVMPYNDQAMDNFVLVDKERRIRGYYSGSDPVEVDRLITELRILLSNYKRQQHEQGNS